MSYKRLELKTPKVLFGLARGAACCKGTAESAEASQGDERGSFLSGRLCPLVTLSPFYASDS